MEQVRIKLAMSEAQTVVVDALFEQKGLCGCGREMTYQRGILIQPLKGERILEIKAFCTECSERIRALFVSINNYQTTTELDSLGRIIRKENT